MNKNASLGERDDKIKMQGVGRACSLRQRNAEGTRAGFLSYPVREWEG